MVRVMRRATVRTGIRLLSLGILIITMATFSGGSSLDLLSQGELGRGYLIGLFCGGAFGGCGIAVAVAGFLMRERPGQRVRLLPSLGVLLATVMVFGALSVYSVKHPRPEQLRPGETISI